MRANAQTTWCLLVAVTALLTGCSVIVESDKKQCSKDSQCAVPYICGKAGLCEIKTGCASKADCREGGACLEGMCKPPECTDSGDDCDSGELCNTELGACVRENLASCTETKDCAPYEGAQVCIKSESLCGGAECKVEADCTDTSPTAMCNGGACDDPTWHCLGVPDPRETPTSSEEASFKVKVLYGFAQNGAKETGVQNLSVRVCQFGDALCTNEVTKDITYGDDNYLVIKGLESGLYYKIQLRANSPATPGLELYPTEYLMYRTVVEETEDPKPILMYEEMTFEATAKLAEVKRDPELGMLLMRIFDCTDTEVAGVTVSPDKVATGCGTDLCETTVFYQNAGNIPDPGASATNTAGRAGILNLRPGVNNRITLTRVADAKKVTAFVVTPRAGWLTYVFFWPWDYGTAAD